MGIAISIFVLPALVIIAIVSIWLAIRSANPNEKFKASSWISAILIGSIGFISAITLTAIATWLVPEDQHDGWMKLFTRIAVVILGPLLLGLAISLFRLLVARQSKILLLLSAGAFWATIPSPIVVPFVLWDFQQWQYKSEYMPLCKDAYEKIYEHIPPAKSVAVLNDKFVDPPGPSQSMIIPMSGFILNQSYLKYIERPATKESGLEGKSKYERVSTDGERVLKGNNRNERTKYIYEPIDNISADYVINSEPLHIEGAHNSLVGGARISIYRREDDKLISRTQYYWSNNLFLTCPNEARGGPFHFIVDSLNVRNPEGPIRPNPK